ncbi:MAG TPA: tail fiber protein [Pyrinomonadaceae bacterium]|nr:tail fiber protein [Pyrinomonadaceae bacterium]
MQNTVVGEVSLFPYNFTPEAFLRCDGGNGNVGEHEALFRLIGTKFGGGGYEFATPDYRDKVPEVWDRDYNKLERKGLNYCVATHGLFPDEARVPGENRDMGGIALFVFDIKDWGRDWMPSDGRTLDIRQHQALFSLLETRFGGNGQTDFKLPDMRKSAPKGSHYAISPGGIYPSRGGSRRIAEAHTGEIRLFPYDFVPDGWALCDGTLLPLERNVALFSLLGTTFGGDGRRTFALPDLSRSTPHGMKYCICTSGMFPPRP